MLSPHADEGAEVLHLGHDHAPCACVGERGSSPDAGAQPRTVSAAAGGGALGQRHVGQLRHALGGELQLGGHGTAANFAQAALNIRILGQERPHLALQLGQPGRRDGGPRLREGVRRAPDLRRCERRGPTCRVQAALRTHPPELLDALVWRLA